MIRPGTSVNSSTNLSKITHAMGDRQTTNKVSLPTLEEFLEKNDWQGAIAVLELEKSSGRSETLLWIGYCYFHLGEYKKAMSIYDEILTRSKTDKQIYLYKSLCLFGLCNFEEARKEAMKAIDCPLKTRLLYQISQKLKDDTTIMSLHHKLEDNVQGQLCVAAVHFLRGHYDDCIDIYKKLLLENKKLKAVNVYLSLCYYKQDYFEIAIEGVQQYLEEYPGSVFAANLKACCLFEIGDGNKALEEIRKLDKNFEGDSLEESFDLIRHNTSVFKNGESALKVFSPLVDLYPEAKMNLILYHVSSGDYDNAFRLVKDLECLSSKQYILKAVVFTLYGQKKGNQEIISQALDIYKLIGTSASECDTVAGRQCTACFMFLKKQYEDVLLYLNTIKEYMTDDDEFNWNYGMTLAVTGKIDEAESALSIMGNEKYRNEYNFVAWLSKCYIINGKPESAWNLYLDMDTSSDTISLLRLIGNECYKTKQFYFSLKAFDILERLDNEDCNAAKAGSAAGIFKSVLLGKESHEHLEEAYQILKSSLPHPNIEQLLGVFENFLSEN